MVIYGGVGKEEQFSAQPKRTFVSDAPPPPPRYPPLGYNERLSGGGGSRTFFFRPGQKLFVPGLGRCAVIEYLIAFDFSVELRRARGRSSSGAVTHTHPAAPAPPKSGT